MKLFMTVKNLHKKLLNQRLFRPGQEHILKVQELQNLLYPLK